MRHALPTKSRTIAVFAVVALLLTAAIRGDDKKPEKASAADPAVMEGLQEVQDIVGQWEGLGATTDKSKNWEEKTAVAWKFNKNGKVSLYWTFQDQKGKDKGRLFEEGMLTFDPAKKVYRFKAYKAGDTDENSVVEFEGKRTKSGLLFDRINKGKNKDELDRLDLKVLNEGDRLVFSVQKKIGTSKVYKSFAQIGMTRQGTSVANREANGPKCIVTGGAGTMTVSHNGETYYVCCTGCRDAFLAEPEKFIAKAKARKS
jgi:YHS domain-containing protein